MNSCSGVQDMDGKFECLRSSQSMSIDIIAQRAFPNYAHPKGKASCC